MKKTNKLITMAAILAFAGLASFGTASAQSFTAGDLLLNFRNTASTGTGAGENLEFNLGLASNFNFSTSNPNVLSGISTDLQTVFGTNWNSNSSLLFSIVGATSTNTLFLSDPNNSNPVTNISPIANSANAGQIKPIYQESSGTLETVGYEVTPTSTDAFSYTDVLTNVNKDHGALAYTLDYGFVPFKTEQAVSSTGASLDLYAQTPAPRGGSPGSVDEGTFKLDGNGTLEFSPEAAAVPEPSTYALLAVGVLALVGFRRFRGVIKA